MPAEESSRSQYERLKRQLQDTILREYPNPERKGCPGNAVLKELAARYLDEDVDQDPNWHHVTHCSECYRDFLAFRSEMKRPAKARRVRIGWGLVAAAVLVGVVLYVTRPSAPPRPERPQIAELVYRPRLVDLEGRSMPRSEGGTEETKPIILGRGPEELTIRLVFGSRPGTYEVCLVKSADQAPLFLEKGEAKVSNGATTLTAKVDLSKFSAGNYFIGVRRVPYDWTYYPAVIR